MHPPHDLTAHKGGGHGLGDEMVVRHQGIHLGPQHVLDVGAGGLHSGDVNLGLFVDIGFHLLLAHRIDHQRGADADHQEDESGAQTKLGFKR